MHSRKVRRKTNCQPKKDEQRHYHTFTLHNADIPKKIFLKNTETEYVKKKSTLLFVSFMQTNSIYPKIQYSYSPCTWKIYFYTLTHTRTPLFQFILIYDRTRSKRIFCKCSKMYSSIFECKSWQNRKNFSQWRDVAILFLQ